MRASYARRVLARPPELKFRLHIWIAGRPPEPKFRRRIHAPSALTPSA